MSEIGAANPIKVVSTKEIILAPPLLLLLEIFKRILYVSFPSLGLIDNSFSRKFLIVGNVQAFVASIEFQLEGHLQSKYPSHHKHTYRILVFPSILLFVPAGFSVQNPAGEYYLT